MAAPIVSTNDGERLLNRTAVKAVATLVLVVFGGTVGYHLIEGWSWFDSLYMVVITLTTIGFSEVHDLSTEGRTFTLGLIVAGVSVGTFAVTQVTRAVLEGDMRRALRHRRMRMEMDDLENHFIVAGYGSLGEAVSHELRGAGMQVVVLDRKPEVAELVQESGDHFLVGDCTEDACLELAGVGRAKGVAITLSNVAEAILATMAARQLNPQAYIVTRVPDASAAAKARRAGATQTVSPNAMGGWRMAHSLFRPHSTTFLDLATLSDNHEISLDELMVPEGSAIAGKQLGVLDVRRRHEITVVAIRRKSGEMVTLPDASDRLQAGDILIAIGRPEAVQRFHLVLDKRGSS